MCVCVGTVAVVVVLLATLLTGAQRRRRFSGQRARFKNHQRSDACSWKLEITINFITNSERFFVVDPCGAL